MRTCFGRCHWLHCSKLRFYAAIFLQRSRALLRDMCRPPAGRTFADCRGGLFPEMLDEMLLSLLPEPARPTRGPTSRGALVRSLSGTAPLELTTASAGVCLSAQCRAPSPDRRQGRPAGSQRTARVVEASPKLRFSALALLDSGRPRCQPIELDAGLAKWMLQGRGSLTRPSGGAVCLRVCRRLIRGVPTFDQLRLYSRARSGTRQ